MPFRYGEPVQRAGRHLASRAVVLACSIALLAGGCGPLDDTPATAGRGEGGTPPDAATALSQLDRLTVAGWASMAGYRRDRFEHWTAQGDSCDTRDVVLQRDGRDVVKTDECAITSGTWFSPYDGATTSDPGDLDIDHMVPLANAWRTGAKEWTEQQREQFANDLTRPQLIAVTSGTNRSKGDQDPSQWRPPRQAYWCQYAHDWVAVKSHWRLSVTAAEKVALEDMLGTCS